MPNVGKPSKGCQHCRNRKAKCDLQRPSCGQCIRNGMKCHGYRDPLSMMFKNENSVVMSKAQRKYQELSQKRGEKKSTSKKLSMRGSTSESSSSDSSTPPQSPRDASQQPSLTKVVTPSIESQAIGFFAANNILQPSIVGRGNYQWLFQMLSWSEVDSTLQNSAYAVSIASLSTANKSRYLANKAQEYYTRALTATNKALGDPTKAYKDSTLVSVILLGTYENFMFENHAMDAWIQHIKGAGMLFALRGEGQFRSDIARQIFLQFYRESISKGVEIGVPIPDNTTRLYRYLTKSNNYTMHGVEHQVEVLEKAIILMRNEDGDPITDVSNALRLDQELDFVKFFLQILWRYETIYLKKPADNVFGICYHIYTNPWVINMWNILRNCRIRLYKFIQKKINEGLECDPPLFSYEAAEARLRQCKIVISTQMLDICASTPQLTGQIAFPHQVKRDFDVLEGGVQTANLRDNMFAIHPQGTFLEPFKSTGLDHLIGPLYELGRSDFGPRLTQWAIDQLHFIARKIGTKQALTLAKELKEKLKDESNFQVWNDPCPTTAQLVALAKCGPSDFNSGDRTLPHHQAS